jgi:hypothetical protein
VKLPDFIHILPRPPPCGWTGQAAERLGERHGCEAGRSPAPFPGWDTSGVKPKVSEPPPPKKQHRRPTQRDRDERIKINVEPEEALRTLLRTPKPPR